MEGEAADPSEALGSQHALRVDVTPTLQCMSGAFLAAPRRCHPDQRRHSLKELSAGWEASKQASPTMAGTSDL